MDGKILLLVVFMVSMATLSMTPERADAWADATYTYRYPIISLGRTANKPIMVNHTIWTQNATGLYLYCKNSGCGDGDKKVGTDAAEQNWENDTTRTGNNPKSVYDANAVAVWHMNNVTGMEYDSSGNSMKLVPIGNGLAAKAGIVGNAVNLSGTDDYYTVANSNNFSASKNLTAMVWVKYTSSTAYMCYLCDESAAGTAVSFRLMQWTPAGTASFHFMYNGGSWSDVLLSTTSVNNGNWHHIVGGINGTSLTLWVDGVLEDQGTFAGVVDSGTHNITVGVSNYGPYSYDFIGTVDEIKIYNRSLTNAEVQDEYFNGLHNLTSLGAEEISVDTTKPVITVVSPTNTTYTTLWFWANVTGNENLNWCGYSYDGATNVSMSNTSMTVWNKNVTAALGYHNITFSCNDTSGNMNSTVPYTYFTVAEVAANCWTLTTGKLFLPPGVGCKYILAPGSKGGFAP